MLQCSPDFFSKSLFATQSSLLNQPLAFQEFSFLMITLFSILKQSSSSTIAALAFAGLCVLAVGCDSGPTLLPVTGKVTVDGQPAAGAVLLFHPATKANPFVSSATTGADGSFSIITDTKPGIPAGDYKVTATYPDPSHKPSDTEIMMGTAEPGQDLLKGRYVSRDASTLKVTIDSSTTQLEPFALTTK
jgi:hypothetical protein